jgi:hypothetical protein
MEDIDAAHLARGAMKVSIQRATLGDHGIGYGLLVETSVHRSSAFRDEVNPFVLPVFCQMGSIRICGAAVRGLV